MKKENVIHIKKKIIKKEKKDKYVLLELSIKQFAQKITFDKNNTYILKKLHGNNIVKFYYDSDDTDFCWFIDGKIEHFICSHNIEDWIQYYLQQEKFLMFKINE